MTRKNNEWSLDDLLKAVETTYKYEKDNYDRYNNMRRFVYYNTISDSQKAALDKLGKPPLSFNSLEAYISRLKGEFAKHIPCIAVSQYELSKVSAEQISFVEGYIRNVINDSDKEGFQNESFDRTLSGGYNVVKVYTEYVNEESFWQNIKIKNSYDPTLCGFDPSARAHHKGDGQYCFEIYPMELNTFKRKYPDVDIEELRFNSTSIANFSWSFRTEELDYIMVCDLYTKKEEKIKVVQLPDGSSLSKNDYDLVVKNWKEIVPPPAIADTRESVRTKICRYRFVKCQIIEEEDTDYAHFPLVYIDGNKISVQNAGKETIEIRRPYFWQAISMQKLKDRAGQTWAHWLENMVTHKWIVSLQSLPSEDPAMREAYINNQIPAVMLYNEISKENPNIKLTPPQPVMQAPMPQEVMQAFTYAEQSFQFMLGSYDSSLGINDNQLSGSAIREGAIQSNAAAKPYLISHLNGLERVADIIADLIPKYLKHRRSVEIVDKDNKKSIQNINGFGQEFGGNSIDTDFNTKKLKVRIKSEVDFSIQKTQAIAQLQQLAVSSPVIANFIGSKYGLPIILDNMEFRGLDKIKEDLPKFYQEMEQQQKQQQQMTMQAQQNNPQLLKAKTEQQRVMNEIEMGKNDNMFHAQEIAIKSKKVENEANKIVLNSHNANVKNDLIRNKTRSDSANKMLGNIIKSNSNQQKHTLEKHKMINETIKNTNETIKNVFDSSHNLEENT